VLTRVGTRSRELTFTARVFSRELEFTARVLCRAAPERSAPAAAVLPEPVLAVRARRTVVIP
jgi:hypothetical protein